MTSESPHRTGAPSSLLAFGLPIATTAGAMLIGIVAGGTAGFVIGVTRDPPPIEYHKTSSLAEMHNQCDPLIIELQTQLANTVGEIELSRGQLALKESDILLLEPMALAQADAPTSADGRNYTAELAAARAQAAEFSRKLELLDRTRGGIVDQLTRVRERMLVEDEALANQIAISDLLRDERGRLRDNDILAAWFAFVTDSQSQICGDASPQTRQILDCRAAVQRELPEIKETFVQCLRAGKPAPAVQRLAQGDPLPAFAHPLDPTNDLVSGWLWSLCDLGPL